MNRSLIIVGLLCMLCVVAVSFSGKVEADAYCHRHCYRENFISGIDPEAVLR